MKPIQPSTFKPCPAVILTGGQSRRMGHDKASLELGGKSMLERVADVLRPRFEPLYLSVRSAPASIPEGMLPLVDIHPGCGPLSGLHAALFTLDSHAVFLTAVDLPFIRLDAAMYLLSQLCEYDLCVIKRNNGYIEPLFAVYSSSCLKAVASLLSQGKYKMQLLLERCNVRYVDEGEIPDSDMLLTNVNTPSDFRLAAEIIKDN